MILALGINLKGTLKRASTSLLRKNVEVDSKKPVPRGYAVHHLISVEVANGFDVMKAAELKGYNINNGHNLVALPASLEVQDRDLALGIKLPLHAGGHLNSYFEKVKEELEKLQKKFAKEGGNWNADKLFSEIAKVEKLLRDKLLDSRDELRLNKTDHFKI